MKLEQLFENWSQMLRERLKVYSRNGDVVCIEDVPYTITTEQLTTLVKASFDQGSEILNDILNAISRDHYVYYNDEYLHLCNIVGMKWTQYVEYDKSLYENDFED